MAAQLSDSLSFLTPNPYILALGVALDLAVGDPIYPWHPVRIVGRALTSIETWLRAAGLNGYVGGVLLFGCLTIVAVGTTCLLIALAAQASSQLAWLIHGFLVYSLLALGALLRHVWKIETALRAGNLAQARSAVGELVGRDTDRMDAGGCRRAAVESVSENLTDGFVSPVFWYVLAGVPGLVLFKVVSTMDSMVGYRTERYLRFGWCGARLDDAMNYVPARVTWLVIVAVAAVVPGFSASKAWTVGLRQHGLLLGPNSGWSEAGAAGALQRRLVGPIWRDGQLVTELWIGDARDLPVREPADVTRALFLATCCGVLVAATAVAGLAMLG